MSVWKSVKNNTMSKNVNLETLEKGLANMGVSLDYNVHTIRNSYGSDSCTAAFVMNGKTLSLGIKQDANGGVSLVGDTWGTGLGGDGKQEALMNRIAQQYNTEMYKETLNEKGWVVDSVTTNSKGEVVIEAFQY